jgi:hypothetical protein
MNYNCVRCGYCCISYLNVVISPKYAHLDEIDFNNFEQPEDLVIGLDGTKPCPHVYWDQEKDLAGCKIHHKKWFKNTPCYDHREEEKCRIGKYVLSNNKEKIKNQIMEA